MPTSVGGTQGSLNLASPSTRENVLDASAKYDTDKRNGLSWTPSTWVRGHVHFSAYNDIESA